MRWLVTSKKNDSNIKFNFENGNIDSKMGSNGAPRGVKRGHSIPYHHQQGGPPPPPPHGDPVWPRFYCRCYRFRSSIRCYRSYRFDDIIFEVDLPVFDISYFPPFMRPDPKSAKNWQLDWIITLLGSACIKAAPKMLMKLITDHFHSPWVLFTLPRYVKQMLWYIDKVVCRFMRQRKQLFVIMINVISNLL